MTTQNVNELSKQNADMLAALQQLNAMLEDYREGVRELPNYRELAAIAKMGNAPDHTHH